MLEEGDDGEEADGNEEDDAEFLVSASEGGEVTVKKLEVCNQTLLRSLM
jgi:hypothetical protein